MSILDSLLSVFGHPQNGGQGVLTQPQATQVAPLDVTAQRQTQTAPVGMTPLSFSPSSQISTDTPQVATPQSQQASPFNYNNSQSASDAQSAVNGYKPQGGSPNPGIYGLLPANLQHGTLRNMLGALGDAFLVGTGHQATYGPRMANQQEGMAMSGMDPNDPQSAYAAAQRIAMTGTPGSAQLADTVMKNTNDVAYRKAMLESTSAYRQGNLESRNQTILTRMGPMAQGQVSAATNQADYAKRYSLLDQRAKSLDPTYDASSAFGIPAPEDWSSTPGYGMTSNQQQHSLDTRRGQDIGYQGRVDAANTAASGHIAAAGVSNQRPSDSLRRQQLGPKIDSGTATPSEQAEWAHLTQVSHPARRGLITGGTGGGTSSGTGSKFVVGQTYHDAKGNKARWDGTRFVDIP